LYGIRSHDQRPYGARSHHPDHTHRSDGPLLRQGHQGGSPGGGRGRRGGGGRAPRGDVPSALLLLLSEGPMHGYQLMRTVADRTGGRWTPSPGAVYPALAQLEDEGLVEVSAQSGRKLVTLSEAGREHVAAHRDSWPDPFAGPGTDAPGADLRGLLEQLHGAARQVARTGTDAQRVAAAQVLGDARRSLYLLLAEGPEAPGA